MSILRTRSARLLSSLAVALLCVGLAGEAVLARKAGLAFDVLRDGSSIGRHEIGFRQEGDDLHVEIAIDLEVKLAFITLFRYWHRNHEVWRDGRLVSIETRTDDDGKLHRVSGRVTAEGFLVEGSEGRTILPAGVLPTSYWHPRTVEQNKLLDTQRGRLLKVETETLGLEEIDGSSQDEAMRYRLSGDLQLDLWYSPEGEWRKLAFVARGAEVTYARSAEMGYADSVAPILGTAR